MKRIDRKRDWIVGDLVWQKSPQPNFVFQKVIDQGLADVYGLDNVGVYVYELFDQNKYVGAIRSTTDDGASGWLAKHLRQ